MHTPGIDQATLQRSTYDSASSTHARGHANPKLVAADATRIRRARLAIRASLRMVSGHLGPAEIREYLVYLTNDRHLAPSSIINHGRGAPVSLHRHPSAAVVGPSRDPRTETATDRS